MARRKLYPGIKEAEEERIRAAQRARAERLANEEPDFIGNAPNYDKYKGIDPERVLMLLNID